MAKKKAPQRLAGAEESCISPEQEAIIQWFRTVKFRKNLLGGVDEAAMWKKLEELYALYEAAIRAERTRYNVLLETSPSKPDGFATSPDRGGKTGAAQPEASGTGEPGNVNLAPTKVNSFAKGSPTRATTTTAASGGNREELLGQRPAGHECNTLHEVDAGSRNPDAGERSETERFSPDAGERSETERFSPDAGERSETERFSPDAGERSETERFDPQKEAHSDAPAGQ